MSISESFGKNCVGAFSVIQILLENQNFRDVYKDNRHKLDSFTSASIGTQCALFRILIMILVHRGGASGATLMTDFSNGNSGGYIRQAPLV